VFSQVIPAVRVTFPVWWRLPMCRRRLS